jgi:hypothetical protein
MSFATICDKKKVLLVSKTQLLQGKNVEIS